MSLVQALVATRLGTTLSQVAAAHNNRHSHVASLRGPQAMTHTDTLHRVQMRSLLTGAALAHAQVSLAFIKCSGQLRNMVCFPCPGADSTARYMTVIDAELSEAAGRSVCRRVDLDTIARCQIDFSLT